MITNFNRRNFIKLSSAAGGGLMLAFLLPGAGCNSNNNTASVACDPLEPSAYLKIESNGNITICFARQEMGQGVNTSLPMIVAEELDADWTKVKTEIMTYHKDFVRLNDPKPGEYYSTGGSQSVVADWAELRKVGATAKAMLVKAAADKWKIPEDQCSTTNSTVTNKNNNTSLSYGALVCDAIKLPIPKKVTLKDPKDFTLVGKALPRKNLQTIIGGKAKYGIDIKVPGMVYAVVERCPVLGGKIKSVDNSACKQVNGFIKTVQFDGTAVPMHLHAGVAVLATDVWSAMKARNVLKVVWDEGDKNNESTDDLFKVFEIRSKQKPANEIYTKGDAAKANNPGGNVLESAYTAPFLAHGTMEPMNMVASVKQNSCELWGTSQWPEWAARELAKELSIDEKNVKINLTYIGGGFGRRLYHDYMIEAAKIAKQHDAPVKVIWDRVDDIRNDAYRPANYHRMKASWSNDGKLLTWQHHVLSTSVNVMIEGAETKNPAEILGGASSDFWYDVPNVHTAYSHVDFNLQRGWLRAVEICMNVFPIECFIDELAVKMKKDPLQFRLDLLTTMPKRNDQGLNQDPKRVAAVLKLACEKIGYHNPRQANHYIGIAAHPFAFCPSYAAHAIEIEMLAPKKFRIIKVIATVDCGIIVNPDGMKNQVEGGLAFALSQALKGEITVKNSRVEQSSFFDYDPLRFNEMPDMEVHYIQSNETPGGIGEVGMPTVAPALCNALAAAGHRPYRLPIKKDGFDWV
jgi:isoquinoline 1-oxidoreductase beta subunit